MFAGVTSVIVGALRSILKPENGPTVTQFSARSQTSTLRVLAFAVSVPAGTLVFRVIEACDGSASPDSSDALHRTPTLVLYHDVGSAGGSGGGGGGGGTQPITGGSVSSAPATAAGKIAPSPASARATATPAVVRTDALRPFMSHLHMRFPQGVPVTVTGNRCVHHAGSSQTGCETFKQ